MVGKNGVPENLKHASEDVQEFGREVYKMADGARRDVIKQLYEVADNIRSQAQDATGEARTTADRIARNLEQTANKLNSRAVDQVEDTTQVMKENVWETTIAVFIIGLLVGIFLGTRK